VGIAEWADDLPVSMRLRLGIGRRAPSESTFRRVLQSVDAHALDTAVSSWLVERSARERATAGPALRAVAVDGKTARGSRCADQCRGVSDLVMTSTMWRGWACRCCGEW